MDNVPHRYKYVWFRLDSSGVVGIPPDEVKHLINRWNKSYFWRWGVNFWDWFSSMIGEGVHAFDVLWNEGNPAMADIPIQRSGRGDVL